VAGLVFVDGSHPEQVQRLKRVAPEPDELPFKLAASLAWTGDLRPLATAFIPQEQNQSRRDVQMVRAYGPTSLGPMLVEYDAINQTLAEAGTFRRLGNRPLFVLTAMQPFSEEELQQMKISAAQGAKDRAIRKQMQDDEATWSSRSRHQLVYDSSRYIQFHGPDLVINAVLWVVDTVRADAAH